MLLNRRSRPISRRTPHKVFTVGPVGWPWLPWFLCLCLPCIACALTARSRTFGISDWRRRWLQRCPWLLGFSDLLADDEALPDKARSTASKIREQARRTKTLVGNLLSFARQVPPERTLLDINTVMNNAVQLRTLDLRSSTTRIETLLESVLPGVRGDGNQLMQVFFNLISNAVDAMESHKGGLLTIKTIRDRGNVVILFSDTGPGIKEPQRVFDPFYTTKPVGKGTGLGLSICFGIIQEHNGRILCYNRQEGGAVFRVELPAVLAAFPAKELQQLTTQASNPRKPG